MGGLGTPGECGLPFLFSPGRWRPSQVARASRGRKCHCNSRRTVGMRVLLIGHACSPRAGSEPGGTWNFVWQISVLHEVCVLAYPHDRDSVEKFLTQHPNKNLSFVWVDLPGSRVEAPRDSGLQSPSLYLLWQALAYKKAIELQKHIA